MAAIAAALGYQPWGRPAGAAPLGRAAPGVSSKQKAGGGVGGAEAQGTQQLLLWHKGAEGAPFW